MKTFVFPVLELKMQQCLPVLAGTFDCRTPAVMTMGSAERTEGEIGERAPRGEPGGWDPRGWLDPGHQLIKNETAHIDYYGERRVVGLACGFG